ncbi:hemerythrin domain-containing protein [Phytoactinopolyspora alkaliphila]|uniref:Hemerythrin domain-containing protein n=1 Tax=Phytoactinopolyspora alkaliphila TaxID=1783498 RepID=A0A6N9YND9_9ACTN|nr:hemerythrin domain-containing protein [Phytoactinopolyspora alkaliphila]NED96556.1 hemerythrin domain-containing protein [Phytoactinopolyspora alkaliphila]
MGESQDVVDLIEQDHREVERIFETMKEQPRQRRLLLPIVTSLLVAHSRAEEAEVYPVARDEAGETDEVAHSQEEHREAEELLARLAQTDPDAPDFESVLQEVVDSVTHHVEEEESTVLPGMRERLSDERRRELGAAFLAARAEHLGEQPGEETREDMLKQAQNMGISGASSMSKGQLEDRLP